MAGSLVSKPVKHSFADRLTLDHEDADKSNTLLLMAFNVSISAASQQGHAHFGMCLCTNCGGSLQLMLWVAFTFVISIIVL